VGTRDIPVLLLVLQEVRACMHNVSVTFQLGFCSSEQVVDAGEWSDTGATKVVQQIVLKEIEDDILVGKRAL
jgi:hypothetical protein